MKTLIRLYIYEQADLCLLWALMSEVICSHCGSVKVYLSSECPEQTARVFANCITSSVMTLNQPWMNFCNVRESDSLSREPGGGGGGGGGWR